MPHQVDFLPFAVGSGANVESQSSYAAETSLLANGFQAGVAPSAKFNKALRQASVMSAALAQFISAQAAADVIDDGTTATIISNLIAAVQAGLATQTGFQQNAYAVAAAGGTADAIAASYAPAVASLTNGMSLLVRAAYANATTTPTLNVNGLGAKTIYKGAGAALAAGDIAGAGHWVEFQYDTTLAGWVLLNPATGVSVQSGMVASSLTTVTATGSLAIAVAGGTILVNSASATTQTLPSASAVGSGKRVEILNIGAGVATVSRAGSDTINANSNSITSVALGQGESITLESNGSNLWYAVTGSVLALGGGGQSWQNVTGSRAIGTTYYNTTGRPILVTANITANSSQNVTGTVNGIQIAYFGNNTASSTGFTVYLLVPAGASYSATSSSGALSAWAELR